MPGPQLEKRQAILYMAIGAHVSLSDIAEVVPPLFPELFAWLVERGIATTGPPFVRYFTIEMPDSMNVEVGVPVIDVVSGDGRVRPGVLQGGTYAALAHRGHPATLFDANSALQAWGSDRGITWDMWPGPDGEHWAGRVEFSLTDPAAEPDMEKWEHEVAYLVADGLPDGATGAG